MSSALAAFAASSLNVIVVTCTTSPRALSYPTAAWICLVQSATASGFTTELSSRTATESRSILPGACCTSFHTWSSALFTWLLFFV